MRLYRTPAGVVLERDGSFAILNEPWDAIVNRAKLHTWLASVDVPAHSDVPAHADDSATGGTADNAGAAVGAANATMRDQYAPLAPIGSQEVWAAGVTYLRSRTARIEEARDAGGGSFYDRVYEAERPELFFKAPAWRVRGHDEAIRIRGDAIWNVPEPELAVYVNARGSIIGYTIGNDVSSRDIEGENPLYLPQAKIYDGSCALGPALLVTSEPLPADTAISLRIERPGTAMGTDAAGGSAALSSLAGDSPAGGGGTSNIVFEDTTTLARMRRTPQELVSYLYRELTFPTGCVLLTGTGIVPPDDFTLAPGDRVTIEIPPIGTLINTVEATQPPQASVLTVQN